MISILFPQARVIHVPRDPLNCLLSCYVQNFPTDALAYTESIEHLARRYQDYQRVMKHWEQTLKLNLLEVCYEELLADLEGATRRMLEHCGLEFDERCLRFYQSHRKVVTLSLEQVDKPIYDSSVGRWRNYETQLETLRDLLGE